MKRYGSLLLLITITFMMLASNVLPSSASPDLIATATKTPKNIKSIIKQIKYFPGGGEYQEHQFICQDATTPTIESTWSDVKQLEESPELLSCGWKLDKDVSAVILKPDRTTGTEQLKIQASVDSAYGVLVFSYFPTAFDPTGTYKVKFSNGEQSLDFKFNVNRITEPGAIITYDRTTNEPEIQIYNFRPYEKIRLFRYVFIEGGFRDSYDGQLKDWIERETGSNGGLRMNPADFPEPELNYREGIYIVVGEKTVGEYPFNPDGVTFWGAVPSVFVISCPGALQSRLAIGFQAQVTTSTRVRKEPTTSASIIGGLPKGTKFSISDGYQCSDGRTWWYGTADNSVEGWVAESEKGTYLLKSVQ